MSIDHDPSFVSLFVKNQRRIYGYILTLVPDCNEADDLFQQTSMVLWAKAGEFRPRAESESEDFVRWGCGIAHNLIRNWRVKRRRDRHCFSDEMMARIAAARIEKSPWLDAALASLGACMDELKPKERDLLDLCYVGRRSIRQLSAELGRTEGAVYQHLHRIRAKLLDCIERKTGEDTSP